MPGGDIYVSLLLYSPARGIVMIFSLSRGWSLKIFPKIDASILRHASISMKTRVERVEV